MTGGDAACRGPLVSRRCARDVARGAESPLPFFSCPQLPRGRWARTSAAHRQCARLRHGGVGGEVCSCVDWFGPHRWRSPGVGYILEARASVLAQLFPVVYSLAIETERRQ